MRKPARHALVAALVAVAPLVVAVAPAQAAPSTTVCNLPEITKSQDVVRNGQVVAIAQQRREKVSGGLLGKSYYRYCARLVLTAPPAGPTIGVATLKHYPTSSGVPIDYVGEGPIDYVAPSNPLYPFAGVSSPIVDVKQGTVGYSVALKAGTPTTPTPTPTTPTTSPTPTPTTPTTPPTTTPTTSPTTPPPAGPVCNLPDVTSSTNVVRNGQVVAVVQQRRQKVSQLLSSYYRYCTRLILTQPPAQPTIGVATLTHYPTQGGAGINYSYEAPITYVAPSSPGYATAGVSSPIVDVRKGTVGYSASLKAAP